MSYKLTANQQSLLDALPLNERVIVLTSSYGDLARNPERLRVTRGSVQAIRGLEARGIVKATHFWRGAVVTRIA
jgi:hypothetical protein